jgi:hypothetical protein
LNEGAPFDGGHNVPSLAAAERFVAIAGAATAAKFNARLARESSVTLDRGQSAVKAWLLLRITDIAGMLRVE